MAYSALSASKPANYFAATLNPGQTWGSGVVLSNSLTLPSLAQIEWGFWSGTGSQLGLINLLNLSSGTLTNVTPGTTDTADVDLTAYVDVYGTSKSYAEVVSLLVLNFSTTDGVNLVVGGSAASPATNPWVAPFADMTTPTSGRIRVLPGFVHQQTGISAPGGLELWGGNLASFPVSGSSKVVRLYTASASLAYRMVFVGRDAAS